MEWTKEKLQTYLCMAMRLEDGRRVFFSEERNQGKPCYYVKPFVSFLQLPKTPRICSDLSPEDMAAWLNEHKATIP